MKKTEKSRNIVFFQPIVAFFFNIVRHFFQFLSKPSVLLSLLWGLLANVAKVDCKITPKNVCQVITHFQNLPHGKSL